MDALERALAVELGGPLVRGVGEGGSSAAWAGALPALRTFVTANYNQPNPHNQAVMASPPTIATGAGTAGAPPAPYTGLTTAYMHNAGTLTQAARTEGGGSATFSTDYRRFPVATIAASGGNVSTTENAITWRATAVVNASSVAFSVLGGSATIPYRFIVDGQYVSLTGTLVSTGGRQYIVLDFGSKAQRTVSIESDVAQALRGIHVAPGDTVSAPAYNYRALVLGDSFIESVGATRNGDGLAIVARDALGWSDVWPSGDGGTGYVATSSGTKYALGTRLAADMDRFTAAGAANVVIVAMGVNDIGMAGIQAAADACLATIRQKAPGAIVFVVGAWDTTAPTAPSANYATCKSAIQAAVSARGGAAAGIYFLDPQGVSYTKFDAVHPDTAGHATLGAWLALQIKTALGA